MIRNITIAALAGAAIAITGPAVAKPGGGGGANINAHANTNAGMNAGMNAGLNARVNSQGSMNASTNANMHANSNSVHTNTTTNVNTDLNANGAATNSQGPTHASPTGIAHANSNSVLARGSVQASTLPGLTTGLTVNNSSGTSIGTVSQIVTGTDGSVRLVVVTNDSGQTFRLAPSTLSISGGVVTTTSTTGG